MGYSSSATTTTLRAKLTPIGRRKLILTNNNLINSFSLGDSDANYYSPLPLTTGQVPTDGGNIGPNNTVSNSVAENIKIKSFLYVDNNGTLTKPVEPQSSEVTTEMVSNGQSIVSGLNIVQNIVDRNDINTDSLVNLFYTFNLPLNNNDDFIFTGATTTSNGFANTGLSGLAQNKIVVIAIDNSTYGEIIDGKSIKLDITTTLPASYTIYSTFQNTGQQLTIQDANYNDKATNTAFLGPNIALLVSDDIQTPNGGDPTLSWATGYDTVKPFSLNGKKLFNLTTNSNISQSADTVVGLAYLDKGFIVLTHPTIVDYFNTSSTATTVTFNSVSSSVVQNITCIANRGEFANSTNRTFSPTDTPRISEVGLYDMDNDLIAIAKLDRHLVKNVNEFLALGIKISL
jgi:hypothetical protein